VSHTLFENAKGYVCTAATYNPLNKMNNNNNNIKLLITRYINV